MKERFASNSPHFLNFAWERNGGFEQSKQGLDLTKDCASKIAEKTEVLVIIGYSFPIFNMPVDTELFKKMINLKFIYVQSPDAENIKRTIIDVFEPALPLTNIIEVKSLDYFHIPKEWKSELTSW